jgi:GNAT superfamily N-acetyltransferase
VSSTDAATGLRWSDTIDDIDWAELSALYRAAPLGDKPPEHLRIAFTNSRYRCVVRDAAGRLIGAGRVLADGVDCAYLCDIAVLPAHQGSGLGQAIVGRLVERARGHRKILLYAVPGKEPFYRRFGFRRLLTAMAIFPDAEAAVRRGYLGD